MTRSLKPIAKAHLKDPAKVEQSAEWLARTRAVLNLTGEQMAAAVGCSVRMWWAYEYGEACAPITLYWTVRALLDERDVTSDGRIRVAGKVG
jgi:hypothetical protein